jgi:ATP/maltotriose-dependent transcriptional regulator MalT
MLCQECPIRDQCRKLCSEAEVYVDQDNAGHCPGRAELHFTEMEKKLLMLLASGRTKAGVRKALNLSAHALNVHIANLRKKSQETDPIA